MHLYIYRNAELRNYEFSLLRLILYMVEVVQKRIELFDCQAFNQQIYRN